MKKPRKAVSKKRVIKLKKVWNLCGIPHRVVLVPRVREGQHKKVFKERKEIGMANAAMGMIDNDNRIVAFERDRADIGWVILHELLHATCEVIDSRKDPATFNKYYGEAYVMPASRLLWSMLVEAGLIKDEFC